MFFISFSNTRFLGVISCCWTFLKLKLANALYFCLLVKRISKIAFLILSYNFLLRAVNLPRNQLMHQHFKERFVRVQWVDSRAVGKRMHIPVICNNACFPYNCLHVIKKYTLSCLNISSNGNNDINRFTMDSHVHERIVFSKL